MAEDNGMETYVVGGYVRDLLMGRPCKDIDILVVGSGIEYAHRLAEFLPGKRKVQFFQNYGTAMLRVGDLELEFVGARKESYRSESRKPIVEDGTLLDDLTRRDFTINSIAISLYPNFGELVDPFNGRQHLRDRLLITPTDPLITFSDDPLRMMRAIRFATQLNFDIHPDTLQAIRTHVSRLSIISRERISDELNKMILAPKPSIGFKLLFDTGLLHQFFPEMVSLQGVQSVNGHAHKDNFYHTLKVLDNICETTNDLWLRWAAILHDIAKPPTQKYYPGQGWTFHGHEELGARMVPQIFRSLKLPLNEKMKFVQKMVKLHLRPIALTKSDITDSAVRRMVFEAGEDMEALMKLCRADITSSNDNKVRRYLKNFDILTEKVREVEEKDRLRAWQPPIDGQELMTLFNIPAGPAVGKLKNAIREAILEGEIENNYEAALEFVLKKAQAMGLQKTING